MAIGMMLALRAVQALLSVLVLALSGYVCNWYNVDTLTTSPSQFNFLIFASLWSMISIAYLEGVSRYMPRASHPYVSVAMEISNVVFWFAGFVALGVFLSKLLFCRGTVCGSAQADTVFSAILFVAWGVSVAMMGKDVFKGGLRKGAAGGNGMGPPMKETA